MVSTSRKKKTYEVTSTCNINSDINSKDKEQEQEGKRKGVKDKESKMGIRGYEEFKEQRIQENKERMQKLVILDLSLKLNSHSRLSSKTPRNVSSLKKHPNRLPPSTSQRRSSRLNSLNPVNYFEIPNRSNKGSNKNLDIWFREGSKPEIYTEEYEKLLGDCKTTWTLSVDGCSKDGKRIYDPKKGETCHQCRYGEKVIEVSKNPNWICPVCRGICNCSCCRKAKGWAPTGSLYRKVRELGFKSVAHFLFQTQRTSTESNFGDQSLDSKGTELHPAGEGFELVTRDDDESLYVDEHEDGFSSSQLDGNEVEMEEKNMHCSDSG